MININGNKILFFRFMADALYILTLRITDKITMIMSEKERNMIRDSGILHICLVCTLVYKVVFGCKITLK